MHNGWCFFVPNKGSPNKQVIFQHTFDTLRRELISGRGTCLWERGWRDMWSTLCQRPWSPGTGLANRQPEREISFCARPWKWEA